MLIVIIIISILFLISQRFLTFNQADDDNWKYCINQIYSQISNFLSISLNNNSVNSWTELISPTSYYINFDLEKNNILLGYKINQTWYIYQTIDLSWNVWIDYNCKKDPYIVILTWNTWLQIFIDQWFVINSWLSIITWEIMFKQCSSKNWTIDTNNCKDIWKYEIDKRISNIQKKLCLYYSWNDCNQWNK